MEQFAELWGGRVDGEQVVSPGARRRDADSGEQRWVPRWSAIDIVSSAPKSVSELLISATPSERQVIVGAWVEANRVGFEAAIEASARLARVPIAAAPGSTRQQGARTERRSADLIAFPVVEFTARPTVEQERRGAPPDPHLHLHLLVMTMCRSGGRFYTADEYGLKEKSNSIYRDQVVSGEFSRRLEALGYAIDYGDWTRARNGILRWEVRGSNPELRAYWSSNQRRGFAIRRAYEQRHGRPMPDRLLNVELGVTRRRKSASDRQQDQAPDFDAWVRDAAAHGLSVPNFPRQPSRPVRSPDLATLEQRLFSPNGLHLQEAVFRRDDLGPAIARAAVGLGFTPSELVGYQMTLEPQLLRVRSAPDRRLDVLTTQALVRAERTVERYLDRQHERGAVLTIVGRSGTGKTSTVAAAVAQMRKRPHRTELDPEQRSVVAAITALCHGVPDQVIVTSVAATTAQRTAEKVGADAHGSVESVCAQMDRGGLRLTSRSLIVVDETSQLDTFRMAALVGRLAQSEARLVLVGDPRQLLAIGASGWWDHDVRRHGASELSIVYRQRSAADVDTLELFREARAVEALDQLEASGRLHVLPNRTSKVEAVLAHYAEALDAGESPDDIRIILGTSNAEVDELNRLVQQTLVNRGLLGRGVLMARQRDQERQLEYHEGDRVLFVAPHDDRQYGRIRNGTTGQIVTVDPDARRVVVRLKTPGQNSRASQSPSGVLPEISLVLQADPLTQPLGLAYAQHVSRLAGDEVPRTIEVPGPQSDANRIYSEHGRHLEATDVFLDRETFGQDAEGAAGRTMAMRDDKQLASALLADGDEAVDVPPDRFDTLADRVAALRLAGIVHGVIGTDAAQRLVASPDFEKAVRAFRRAGSTRHAEFSDRLKEQYFLPDQDPSGVIRAALGASTTSPPVSARHESSLRHQVVLARTGERTLSR